VHWALAARPTVSWGGGTWHSVKKRKIYSPLKIFSWNQFIAFGIMRFHVKKKIKRVKFRNFYTVFWSLSLLYFPIRRLTEINMTDTISITVWKIFEFFFAPWFYVKLIMDILWHRKMIFWHFNYDFWFWWNLPSKNCTSTV